MERNNGQVKNVWKPLCLVFAALLTLSWVLFGLFFSAESVSFSALETPGREQADCGGMLVSDSTGSGAQIMSVQVPVESYEEYGVSPMAESAYRLTATVIPEYADNKAVNWGVAFVNSSSEWATGKTVTDYVTVTPTADGALTAIVVCLKAFGERVLVTVQSRGNAGATADCVVDYAKKVTAVDCRLDKGVSGTDGMIFSTYASDYDFFHYLKPDLSSSFSYNDFSYEFQVGIGTLEDSFEFSSVLRFSDKFIEAARLDLSSFMIDFSYESDYSALLNTGRDFVTSVFGENVVNNSSNLSYLNDYLNGLATNNLPVYSAGVLSLELNFTGKYSSYQKVVPLLFSFSGVSAPAASADSPAVVA